MRPARARRAPVTYWEEYVETDEWYRQKLLEDVPESELHAAIADEDFDNDELDDDHPLQEQEADEDFEQVSEEEEEESDGEDCEDCSDEDESECSDSESDDAEICDSDDDSSASEAPLQWSGEGQRRGEAADAESESGTVG